jgi:hypothetical protein
MHLWEWLVWGSALSAPIVVGVYLWYIDHRRI